MAAAQREKEEREGRRVKVKLLKLCQGSPPPPAEVNSMFFEKNFRERRARIMAKFVPDDIQEHRKKIRKLKQQRGGRKESG